MTKKINFTKANKPKNQVKFVYDPKEGVIKYLATDDLPIDFHKALGTEVIVNRASHVEPNEDGSGWYVDLEPVGGPKIEGFSSRKEALAYEHKWLEDHDIPLPKRTQEALDKKKAFLDLADQLDRVGLIKAADQIERLLKK